MELLEKEKLYLDPETSSYEDAINKASSCYNETKYKYSEYVKIIDKLLEVLGESHIKYIPSAEQLRVLLSQSQNLIIEAGPGTGKTTTMTAKLYFDMALFKYISDDVKVLTYTNASAQDLMDKFKNFSSAINIYELPSISTIHGFANKFLLKKYNQLSVITEDKGITISMDYDEDDEDADYEDYEQVIKPDDLLNNILNKPEFEKTKWDFIANKRNILQWFAVLTERDIQTEEEFKSLPEFNNIKGLKFEDIMLLKRRYKKEKENYNCLDYNDMLEKFYTDLTAIESLETIPDKLKRVIKLKKIYIDEVQDISPLQVKIILELLRLNPECKLFCIGDGDQSVYSFRGADVSFTLKFEEIMNNLRPNTTTERVFMTINRRCPIKVLNLANELIKFNKKRIPKVVMPYFNPKMSKEELIDFNKRIKVELKLDLDNTKANDDILKYFKDTKDSLANTAILYREHSQSYPVILDLIKNRIPFNLSRTFNLEYINEYKDITRFLLYTVRKNHNEGKDLLFKFLPGVTKKESDLIAKNIDPGKSFVESLPQRYKDYGKSLDTISDVLSGQMNVSRAVTIAVTMYQRAYYDRHVENGFGDESRLDFVVKYLTSGINESYQALLDRVYNDSKWLKDNSRASNGLVLKTLHSCKGTEYKNVYIIGIDDGYFPKRNTINQLLKISQESVDSFIEEERRLLYVGITRAKNNLFLYSRDVDSLFTKELIQAVKQSTSKQ